MRGNAHRMNLLQLREQQEINRQRLREAEATTQNKAGSCLQGRQGYNKGTTLQSYHTMMNKNNINNNIRQKKKVSGVSDDVQINVYIRECDTDDEENDFANNGCNGSNDDDDDKEKRNERHSGFGAKATRVHTYYERGNELIEQLIGSSNNAVRKTNASVAARNTGRLSQYELTRNNCTTNNYDNNDDEKFGSHSLSSPLRFGQGESIQTLYSSKRRNTNNKNNNNCYGSTNNMISNELEGKNKHEEFGNPGKVPRYLQRRKDELHAEKEAIAEAVHQREELAKIPPGQRLVSDDEKCKMLEQFAERKKELELQLSKLPIRFDTENIKNKRRNIYDELSKLEDLERKYSTKKPLYIPL